MPFEQVKALEASDRPGTMTSRRVHFRPARRKDARTPSALRPVSRSPAAMRDFQGTRETWRITRLSASRAVAEMYGRRFDLRGVDCLLRAPSLFPLLIVISILCSVTADDAMRQVLQFVLLFPAQFDFITQLDAFRQTPIRPASGGTPCGLLCLRAISTPQSMGIKTRSFEPPWLPFDARDGRADPSPHCWGKRRADDARSHAPSHPRSRCSEATIRYGFAGASLVPGWYFSFPT